MNIKILKTFLVTFLVVIFSFILGAADVVGYVNTVIPPVNSGGGFAIIANPFLQESNDISQVIPVESVPIGTTIYFWDSKKVNFVIVSSSFNDDDIIAWSDNLELSPGEGFWIKNPSNSSMELLFLGQVAQGILTNQIPLGFSIKSSIVPQTGDLKTILGYPALTNSTTIYFWRDAKYIIRNYGFDDEDNEAWSGPTEPQIGEGFWVKEKTPRLWVRNFQIFP